MDEGGFVIDYLTPAGTALAETDRLLRACRGGPGEDADVAAFSRRTGAELGMFATEDKQGRHLVRLWRRDRSASATADEVIDSLRDQLHEAAPGLGDRVRPAPAGHAGGPQGGADTDPGQDLR